MPNARTLAPPPELQPPCSRSGDTKGACIVEPSRHRSKVLLSEAVRSILRRHMVEKRAFTTQVILWGVGVGIFQAFAPAALWWLDAVDVWGVALAVIAAIYVGFAVGDGRRKVIAVEVTVAFAFVICATAAMASYPWLIVIGLVGHGLKDLWQHRTQFVANTRWWPPFCFVVDVVAAALTAALLSSGFDLHSLLSRSM
jgi:hypothetical protein